MDATEYEYDLVVIGGGSGGMASAKMAATLGAKVALFDFVKPSTQGTKWGLGGTCVNVGCVPKKLMHYAGLLGAGFEDARHFGWQLTQPHHTWDKLVESVQNHVRSLNFSYRVGLKSAQVNYINALAKFKDPHTVSYTLRGAEKTITSKYFIVAVGGRPSIPSDVPGAAEFAITSDDIFALDRSPGKTLCVGGSYIALECAGFLTELGYPTSVAVRSILLRGFDRQCADKVGAMMAEIGTRFLNGFIPTKIVKTDAGKLEVTLANTSGESVVEQFDTVLYATGRHADTAGINLEAVGVKSLKNGKIAVVNEQTNVPNIFAIGDCIDSADAPGSMQELTPVAIKAGELLAKRMFGHGTEQMSYHLVPTAVFTPFEYGTVGYSEEEAISRWGADNIESYMLEFASLEIAAAHRKRHPSTIIDPEDDALSPHCFAKLVCLKPEKERVVGFHFVGPNAGEVTQGYALAIKLGATKKDFDDLIGIHPTDAEVFTQLDITRSSGLDFRAAGGCGGGKCG